MRRKYLPVKHISLLPRLFVFGLIIALTGYTLVLFSDLLMTEKAGEIFFYLTPALILFLILKTVVRHERVAGILFIGAAFVFLFMYHFYVSATIFLALLLVGSYFMFDGYHRRGYRSQSGSLT